MTPQEYLSIEPNGYFLNTCKAHTCHQNDDRQHILTFKTGTWNTDSRAMEWKETEYPISEMEYDLLWRLAAIRYSYDKSLENDPIRRDGEERTEENKNHMTEERVRLRLNKIYELRNRILQRPVGWDNLPAGSRDLRVELIAWVLRLYRYRVEEPAKRAAKKLV